MLDALPDATLTFYLGLELALACATPVAGFGARRGAQTHDLENKCLML